MQKVNRVRRWFYVWLHKINISSKVKDLTLNDRKSTIIDQLSFGLTTQESIKLFQMVKTSYEAKLLDQKEQNEQVNNEINSYFN